MMLRLQELDRLYVAHDLKTNLHELDAINIEIAAIWEMMDLGVDNDGRSSDDEKRAGKARKSNKAAEAKSVQLKGFIGFD